MSDITFNRYATLGTAAQRILFVPDPTDISSIGPGEFLLPLWLESDTGDLYGWNQTTVAWVQITSGAGGLDQLTGDVTAGPGSGSQVATIANDAVTFAKMQDINTVSLIGRNNPGIGDPQEILVLDGLEFQVGFPAIQRSALTGDVTATAGSNATTIANDAVTYAKIQNVSAASRVLGRGSASGSGDVEELTLGAGLSMTGTVLDAVGGGGGITQLTGDVTAGPGSGSQAATIPADTVTFAKMQNIATDSLIGRDTAASGDPENILLNATLSMDGSGNLQRAALTGDVTAPAGSNTTTVANVPSAAIDSDIRTKAIGISLDGGGIAITTGIKIDISVPFTCTITGVRMLADVSTTTEIDIWKDTYANYPPVVGDSITAAAIPTITAALKSEDTTLTGWTVAITAGDTLRFNVDSNDNATRINLTLTVVT